MKYVTTRSSKIKYPWPEVLFKGLAPDRGLFIPEFIPRLPTSLVESFPNRSLAEIGAIVLEPFINDISQEDLTALIQDSLSFEIPLRKIGDHYVFELFHGPTEAFKDVASQIIPRIMEHYLRKYRKRIMVLTATSGDTGAAVAHGFGNREHISAVVLFPKGRVSAFQRYQMTHVAPNVVPIEVKGTFDDCQQLVKLAFEDERFKAYNLTSANSINIGRLLPQMIYYAYLASRLEGKRIRCIVPSGNMGNCTAGIYAKKMGISIDSFVIACNANDPVVHYSQTGMYRPQETIQTLSTAMDIGNPSNFERILSLFNHDHEQFVNHVKTISISDKETVETIQTVYANYKYLLDPHTAVAWSAGNHFSDESYTNVILATASPRKFAGEIKRETGIEVPCGQWQSDFPYRCYETGAQLDEIVHCIQNTIHF